MMDRMSVPRKFNFQQLTPQRLPAQISLRRIVASIHLKCAATRVILETRAHRSENPGRPQNEIGFVLCGSHLRIRGLNEAACGGGRYEWARSKHLPLST